MRQYFVYIMASKKDGVLYIGMTNELSRRGGEHKEGAMPSFTQKYWVHRLVYYESYDNPIDAIRREKKSESVAARLEGSAY